MKEDFVVHGVVLSEHSQREFDKRLSILTMEQGKMTVWASGAKRPSSPLMAGSRSFVFGTFSLKKGKSGYNLQSVKVDAYFEEIALDLEMACYAAYFLELADFVSQENLPAEEMVNLLYLSLKALLHKDIPNELVRAVPKGRQCMMLGNTYLEAPCKSFIPLLWKKGVCGIFVKMWSFLHKKASIKNFAALRY